MSVSGLRCKQYPASPYASREERSRFAYTEYQDHFGKSVLDVGGFRGGLGGRFPGRYEFVDMVEGADHVINLDRIDRLPFSDRSFDTVVCTDVLEHLENIHLILDEICRVAAVSVVISMPNAWNNALYILGGLGRQLSGERPRRLLDRHWTLPKERPPDRHRWFYSLSEADELLRWRGGNQGFTAAASDAHVYARPGLSFGNLVRGVHRRAWAEEDFANLYAAVGWWVLRRK